MLTDEECEQMWDDLEFDTGFLLREAFKAQKIRDVLNSPRLGLDLMKWSREVRTLQDE